MKFLGQGIALTVLGAGLAAFPGLQAQATPTPTTDDRSIVQKMKDEATGSTTFTREDATGKVGFVRAGVNGDLLADTNGTAVEKADTYLDRYAAAFGATPAQLVRGPEVATSRAGSTVTYTQQYRGVPVFGAMLRAQVDRGGDLTSVSGFATPDLNLSVDPRLSAKDAGDRALAAVSADPPGHGDKAASVAGLTAKSADLMVYRTGSTRGADGENVLAYVVEVTNGRNIREIVFVDAQTDKLLNRYSMIHDGLEREIYERAYTQANKVYDEGENPDPSGLNADQRNIYEGSGEAYRFFDNVFGRDSYDGAGAVMRIVNNDPTISCPNANWNGTTTNYCNGVTSDDVVAHEWGHAYTEKTHGLIYQYQSGALNESYSDIWGETVDLINGRMDEGEGDISAKRPDGLCSSHTPALPQLRINTPSSIAKICSAGGASFGPQVTNPGVTQDVVVGLDPSDAAGPSTTDGCSAFTNGAAVTGRIALVDRGSCGFAIKVKNAQNAGAVAVVVGNTTESVQGMAGTDSTITIPSVLIKKSDRDRIASALSSGSAVNATMRDGATSQKTESYRWLMGEKSTAFGGAIRDMWQPTCMGDAGKVSDAEYFCAPEDGGGVHSNSGVPNHAYALTVDGGSYNGYDITGLGMTKAAAVYYRAMTAYQTPTTDFEDHADALKASCVDLIGAPLKELSTARDDSRPSTQTIAAADCATFDAVAAAVEFRKEPVQCNFQPMLNGDRPTACSGKDRAETVYKQTFENGIPGSWDADVESVYGHPGSPWVASTDAPTGDGAAHPGGVAYGPAPDQGSCNGTAADFSTRDGLISPSITVPAKGNLQAPKLAWDHYMASEAGYDGGNVKYRVNGGEFEVIPTSAYINNGPSGSLTGEAAGNTNPMAGEQGFTGTDGGSAFGSWGQSQVDLSMLGVAGGDEVEFRFDIGRDGCGGNDGWYVDNVQVTVCKVKGPKAAAAKP